MTIKRNDGGDLHFKMFAKSLERAIEGSFTSMTPEQSEEDVTQRQRRQVETLVRLEREFRKALVAIPAGRAVYHKFVHFITKERRNILDARPFFRERYNVFVDKVSPALKAGSAERLWGFDINYQFVQFAMRTRKWGDASKGLGGRFDGRIVRLAKEIEKIRTELVTMNLPLAINRVKIFWSRTQRSHLEYMDYVQYASEGLIAAVDKFCLPYTPVFRSVAIGRMVGNFIEAYSATMLHFYPSDKRKLYRANKAVGRASAEEIGLERLVSEINRDAEPAACTNQNEIVDLMSAAACVSADAPMPNATAEDEERSIDRFVAPDDWRPDVRVERAEAASVAFTAVRELPLIEQKFLRLSGVEF